jgi:hypothetical protein
VTRRVAVQRRRRVPLLAAAWPPVVASCSPPCTCHRVESKQGACKWLHRGGLPPGGRRLWSFMPRAALVVIAARCTGAKTPSLSAAESSAAPICRTSPMCGPSCDCGEDGCPRPPCGAAPGHRPQRPFPSRPAVSFSRDYPCGRGAGAWGWPRGRQLGAPSKRWSAARPRWLPRCAAPAHGPRRPSHARTPPCVLRS